MDIDNYSDLSYNAASIDSIYIYIYILAPLRLCTIHDRIEKRTVFTKLREGKLPIQTISLAFMDILIVLISMAGALWIRMDFRFGAIDPIFLNSLYDYMVINVVCTLLLFKFCRFYKTIWRFAGFTELKNVVFAVAASTVLQFAGMRLLDLPVPRSYHPLYMLLLFTLTAGTHFFYRFLIFEQTMRTSSGQGATRVMIVGAGKAGNMLIHEMQSSTKLNYDISCIIDDDPSKIGSFLHSIPVVGSTDQIPDYVEKYRIQEIIIAIPSMSPAIKKQLLNICQQTACKIKLLPGIYQLVNDEVRVSMLREVQINDLLGRQPVNLEMESIMGYVSGKVILVTGGGGSIGSEICRQLALHHPKKLIILEIYENSAYDIRNELLDRFPDLNLDVLIGSVRNRKRVDSIFETYHPDLVFHAAAHKHVPLMEDSPNEAIKNNVLGTWNVARAADQYGAQKMVLISTDKAVRPTNIMGASKRVCELIVQCLSQTSKTEFAAVRFGNVLGSNGSVVPLFTKQIAHGGPVTVTHPEVIRYFMTIPEAVNLVLQCGALAKGGEMFILDMGEPVKIADLAAKMIRLSGLEPGKDIEIRYIGLRPGEKLYEELLISLDNLKKTENERIFVVQHPEVDEEWIWEEVQSLIESAFEESSDIREQVKRLVPEYVPQENDALTTA